MATVRETVRLGLAARGQAKLKVRQPLRAAVVVAAGAERDAIERLAGPRARRAQRQGDPLRLAGRRARLLRGQAQLPGARPALRQARCRRPRPPSPRSIPRTSPPRCATAAPWRSTIDGHDHELGADDLMLAMSPLEGYQLEREGSHAVALELELDDELRREGLAREIVHAIQNARKGAGPAGRGPHRAGARRRRRSCWPRAVRTRTTSRETLALSVEFNGASASSREDRGPAAPHRGPKGLMRLAPMLLLALVAFVAPAHAAPPVKVTWPKTTNVQPGAKLTVQVASKQRRAQLAFIRVSPRATLARKTLRNGRFTVTVPAGAGVTYELRSTVAGARRSGSRRRLRRPPRLPPRSSRLLPARRRPLGARSRSTAAPGTPARRS